jgi:aminoglycoside N3'-acetyltransferase
MRRPITEHFPVIGAQYLSARRAMEGTVGEAEAVYLRMRDLVDFARDYFERVL